MDGYFSGSPSPGTLRCLRRRLQRDISIPSRRQRSRFCRGAKSCCSRENTTRRSRNCQTLRRRSLDQRACPANWVRPTTRRAITSRRSTHSSRRLAENPENKEAIQLLGLSYYLSGRPARGDSAAGESAGLVSARQRGCFLYFGPVLHPDQRLSAGAQGIRPHVRGSA